MMGSRLTDLEGRGNKKERMSYVSFELSRFCFCLKGHFSLQFPCSWGTLLCRIQYFFSQGFVDHWLSVSVTRNRGCLSTKLDVKF